MKIAYSAFNSAGNLEEFIPLKGGLPVGCLIYCYGYGMEGTQGIVVSEADLNGGQKCAYAEQSRHGFFTIDSLIQPHSKKFGIGRYYDDQMQTAGPEAVAKYSELATLAQEAEETARLGREEADRLEIVGLPISYPHLSQNSGQDQNTTKKNVVAELKRIFPGVKFSGKKEYYDCYTFSWADGPTEESVREHLLKFEDHKTDVTGDFRDPKPSNFNKAFGGFKYASANRTLSRDSEPLRAMLDGMLDDYRQGENSYFAAEILRKIIWRTPFEKGKFPKSVQRNSVDSGNTDALFDLVF